ncbi:tripartite tricarboxylate transporter substrate binding protein [Ramlibacter sp. AW1]|uniref:Tripartite tricarboxylate transporter substrate binding protein n=1 Tax=Ramlibacter aurantiacus TaxID=2801330 RepID=A0A937D236_9BURK|nr:tripartite tricarboxylate transporter substrate binding protein [Ramlibacter aurantiacus]MBL0419375.1 tripartite tricarboxylate transporter substrate binding protein [Ramlibacter aurantiacus]
MPYFDFLSRRGLIGTALALAAGGALAQASANWPTRPVKLVVAFAPGGTVDVVARHVAERLTPLLGQPVIVENRPGAGGNLATEAVLRSPPDGTQFLVAGSPTHAVNPHLFKLSYDPIGDMASVALLGTAPNLLVVNPQLNVQSVRDLANLARSKPGELSFSSAGNGTSGHLAGELFRKQAGVEVRHVPYKGQADALLGVMRGDVAFAFVTLAGTLQQVSSGRLKALAITSRARSPLAPDIPTVMESGIPDFEVLAWYSVSAPKGTPPEAVDRLTRALGQVMKDPATLAKFETLGAEPTFLSGASFVEFMKRDSDKWGRVIREAGVQVN